MKKKEERITSKYSTDDRKVPLFPRKIYVFFGVPHLATLILFLFNEYVIAYIHPVYGGIQTHVLLVESRESSALTTRPRFIPENVFSLTNLHFLRAFRLALVAAQMVRRRVHGLMLYGPAINYVYPYFQRHLAQLPQEIRERILNGDVHLRTYGY